MLWNVFSILFLCVYVDFILYNPETQNPEIVLSSSPQLQSIKNTYRFIVKMT